jgi:hypothetical protein
MPWCSPHRHIGDRAADPVLADRALALHPRRLAGRADRRRRGPPDQACGAPGAHLVCAPTRASCPSDDSPRQGCTMSRPARHLLFSKGQTRDPKIRRPLLASTPKLRCSQRGRSTPPSPGVDLACPEGDKDRRREAPPGKIHCPRMCPTRHRRQIRGHPENLNHRRTDLTQGVVARGDGSALDLPPIVSHKPNARRLAGAK